MDKYIPAAIVFILAVFLVHAIGLNFIQDDAFISYRYVKNFVAGQGLVFNPGERVEGYTNFLWVILLALFTALGLNTIVVSKVLGLAAGCGTLILLYGISHLLLTSDPPAGGKPAGPGIAPRILALAPPLLLAANGAFAYWCISGLETGLFVMAVLLAVYFYLTRERLMIIGCALCSLIRPEGVLIFAIIMIHKFFFRKDGLRTCALYVAGFTALLLPYLVFKIAYYGDPLPNPFYAKTGLSREYLATGLLYFWLFLKHYGLWGLLYLATVPLYAVMGKEGRLALVLIWIYTLYVIVVGGDVLQGHRFFLPLVPFLYFLVARILMWFSGRARKALRPVWPAAILFLALAIFLLPRQWLLGVRRAEIGLGTKMALTGTRLNKAFGSDFTLAASTIGAISYYSEATVIDMLGLTDPYIAKNPEQIPGIESPWKERRFNSGYLLSRDPDAILFSTGMKPSAPAERALFLNSRFREGYYPYYLPRGNLLEVVYRRKQEAPAGENRLFPDAAFVNLFNEAMNLENSGHLAAAAQKVEEIISIGPPDFSWAYNQMASLNFLMKNREQARYWAQKTVALDDHCILSHFILNGLYLAEGDSAAARIERDKILRYNPEFLQLLDRAKTSL
jgi:tetratricopeptide (TPR) repeat protein